MRSIFLIALAAFSLVTGTFARTELNEEQQDYAREVQKKANNAYYKQEILANLSQVVQTDNFKKLDALNIYASVWKNKDKVEWKNMIVDVYKDLVSNSDEFLGILDLVWDEGQREWEKAKELFQETDWGSEKVKEIEQKMVHTKLKTAKEIIDLANAQVELADHDYNPIVSESNLKDDLELDLDEEL